MLKNLLLLINSVKLCIYDVI